MVGFNADVEGRVIPSGGLGGLGLCCLCRKWLCSCCWLEGADGGLGSDSFEVLIQDECFANGALDMAEPVASATLLEV